MKGLEYLPIELERRHFEGDSGCVWCKNGNRAKDCPPAQCPDGGTCHHDCAGVEACFRVACCAPLSGVFPNDEWPKEKPSPSDRGRPLPITHDPD